MAKEESPKFFEREWYFQKIRRLMEDGGPLDKLTGRRYIQSRFPEEYKIALKEMPEADECLYLLQEIKKQDIHRGAKTFENVDNFLEPGQDESASFFHIWTFRDIFTSEIRTFGEKETHIGKLCRSLVLGKLEESEKRNTDFNFFDVCHQVVSTVYREYAASEKKRTKAKPTEEKPTEETPKA